MNPVVLLVHIFDNRIKQPLVPVTQLVVYISGMFAGKKIGE